MMKRMTAQDAMKLVRAGMSLADAHKIMMKHNQKWLDEAHKYIRYKFSDSCAKG